MLKMVLWTRSGSIYFLNIFYMIRMMTLNWSYDLDGIFMQIPPGRPLAFVLTSSTKRAKSLYEGFAALLALSIYAYKSS